MKIIRTKQKTMTRPDFRIPWKQDLYDQVHFKNEDAIIAIIGKRRKGKSITGLGICESQDPDGFTHENIRERVFMHPIKFMEWARKPEKELYKGMAIMFDEAGVGIPSREWQNFNNRALFKVMQIFGRKNFVAVFTLPNLSFMDSGPRSLVDYVVEVLKIDYHRNMNVCKVKELFVDPMSGKYRTPFCRYKVNGVWYKFSKPYYFKKPSAKLVHAYEKLQSEFKQEFEDEIYAEAKMLQKDVKEKAIKKMINETDLINTVLKNRESYARLRGGRWVVDQQIIEFEFKVGRGIAARVKKVSEQKLNKDILY